MTSATYNAANQLTNWNGTVLTYDLNGNLTSQGARTFAWDARNRLEAIGGVSTASFVYDGLGRRSSRAVDGWTTDFLSDGVMTVQEIVGGVPSANLLNGPRIDELLSRTDGLGTRVLLAEVLGSTIALTDLAGVIKTQYTYDPFGTVAASGEASGNATAFTGREADGTGLHHYRARYYDPQMHRFTSEDPAGLTEGPNLYAYVRNSPTNLLDPSGLWVYRVHVLLTNLARAGAGFPPGAPTGSDVADVDGRPGALGTDAATANSHGMAGRKPNGQMQNCQQAYQGALKQLLDAATGDLAKALHLIQDAYSPAHYPFKPWYGGYTAFHLPSPLHGVQDLWLGSAANAAVTASTMFLNDILQRSGNPIDPSKYLPPNPCR